MDTKKVVISTASSREEAEQIGHTLVERRLAACVNIAGPVQSVYRWKEEVESSEEWLLIVKTTAGAFERVRNCIRELHSYEVPECIEIPIEDGSAEYLKWLADNVS